MKKAIGFAAALLIVLLLGECIYSSMKSSPSASSAGGAPAANQVPEIPANAPLAFDPDVVAGAETRMWQAYYGGGNERVGIELISLMRNQFGLDNMTAASIALPLAEAASKFQAASGDYESVALGPLKTAYSRLAKASGRDFDSDEAARAELAWWVARRTPGENSPENVGKLLGGLYAVLYGKSDPHLDYAGLLRAQAAHLRDNGGSYDEVEKLLRESYRHLAAAAK